MLTCWLRGACACVLCLCLPADSPPACLQMRAGSLMVCPRCTVVKTASRPLKQPPCWCVLTLILLQGPCCAACGKRNRLPAGASAGWQHRPAGVHRLCGCRAAAPQRGHLAAVLREGGCIREGTLQGGSSWVHNMHSMLFWGPGCSLLSQLSNVAVTGRRLRHVRLSLVNFNLKFAERPSLPCHLCMCRAPGVGDQNAAAAC